jgi:uncharacterized protein YjbJ (UPF0337 family)
MKKQIKGYSNVAGGSSRKAAGKVFGDKQMEALGTTQKAIGKIQVAAGYLESDIKKIKK